jgi:hypothetical protein
MENIEAVSVGKNGSLLRLVNKMGQTFMLDRTHQAVRKSSRPRLIPADRIVRISSDSDYFTFIDMHKDTAITIAKSADCSFYRVSIAHNITSFFK